MLLAVPQSKLTGSYLQEAFCAELEQTGCAQLFSHFALSPDPEAHAEASRTGPNGVNEADRTVSGVANAFSISRSGIRVHLDGLDLSHYAKNPVVLASHRSVSADLMPGAIGQIERVYRAEDNAVLRFRNLKFDTDPLAEAWYQKVKSGTVRMVSIGFIPLEWNLESEVVGRGKDKKEVPFIDIPQSELLEISVCAVGANRGAYIGHDQQLAQRLATLEAQTAKLQQALDTYLRQEQEAASQRMRGQLLAAINSFGG